MLYIVQIRVFDGEKVKRIKKSVELGVGAKLMIPKQRLEDSDYGLKNHLVDILLNSVF